MNTQNAKDKDLISGIKIGDIRTIKMTAPFGSEPEFFDYTNNRTFKLLRGAIV